MVRKRIVLLKVAAAGAAALMATSSGSYGRAETSRPRPPETESGEHTAVRVETERSGKATRLFVVNDERCEVTMTFEMSLSNLASTEAFPCTATYPPGRTEAFALSPVNPDAPWEFNYTNYYKLGSTLAAHDDSVVYLLPYAPGRSFKVTQGYNGRFSHQGSNRYAIDWEMPEGTPVRAARGGLVVKVKDDSDRGGDGMQYDRFNNYVLIRHDDGTLGHYCHLKKGGARVAAGQVVRAGDVIALSGNTGFSTGAHLHFCVFKTRNGRERLSIPVKFLDASGQAVTLAEGRRYRAADAETAQAATTARPAPGSSGHGG